MLYDVLPSKSRTKVMVWWSPSLIFRVLLLIWSVPQKNNTKKRERGTVNLKYLTTLPHSGRGRGRWGIRERTKYRLEKLDGRCRYAEDICRIEILRYYCSYSGFGAGFISNSPHDNKQEEGGWKVYNRDASLPTIVGIPTISNSSKNVLLLLPSLR